MTDSTCCRRANSSGKKSRMPFVGVLGSIFYLNGYNSFYNYIVLWWLDYFNQSSSDRYVPTKCGNKEIAADTYNRQTLSLLFPDCNGGECGKVQPTNPIANLSRLQRRRVRQIRATGKPYHYSFLIATAEICADCGNSCPPARLMYYGVHDGWVG